MSEKDNGKSRALLIVPFIVAYIGSRLIFHFVGFSYSPFTEPFDGTKLFIDIAVFGALYFASFIALRALLNRRQSEEG
ncbi:hypothetical protein [Marinimicrobium locisalis]|uniref:hypothetical protein n=1 Tax=Marinimicrobium locisalis TaxID=546022 RepID=UPI003221E4FB